MNILVLGGTRFFGIHLVGELLEKDHTVTIATRGKTPDAFGNSVKRMIIDRTDPKNLKDTFNGKYYDVICDSLAYCSNDIKNILDAVQCGRYIMNSSTAIYDKHINTLESDFDALQYPLKYCGRMDYTYDEVKRQAECALFQGYPHQESVAFRFPFGIGKDDYTKRLYFYVEHTIKGSPMNVDNLDRQMGFINSKEAGNFIGWLAEQRFKGPINGCNSGTISLAEIIGYVQSKTGCKANITQGGENAPYNGEYEYSINTELAESLGFTFTPLKSWIYQLLDKYIELAKV